LATNWQNFILVYSLSENISLGGFFLTDSVYALEQGVSQSQIHLSLGTTVVKFKKTKSLRNSKVRKV